MNANFTASLLHQLPFGIIVARGTRIAFISDYFKREFGVTLDTIGAFGERHARLLQLMGALAQERSAALELEGRPFSLKAFSLHNDMRGFLLLPQVFAAGLAPADEGLREQYLDLQEIFQQSLDGMCVTDGDGRVLLVNAGCERNYGIRAADLLGHPLSAFEGDGGIEPALVARVIEERKRLTATQRTHAGKRLQSAGMPLLDAAGKVRKVIIHSRDTTRVEQLEEELARCRVELEKTERELRNLLGRLELAEPGDGARVPGLPEAPVPKREGLDHRGRVAQFEEDLVAAAFRQFGSTRAAARHLGISQSSVVRKLKANAP